MKIVNINEIDPDNSFFSFTKKENLVSINRIGITTKVKRENLTEGDVNVPAIYFSKGFIGLLKTLDVFIRWEYNKLAKQKGKPTGDVFLDKNLMQEVFKKIYNDEKDRVYFKLELKEGNDVSNSDFSPNTLDFKKIRAKEKGYINSSVMLWEWGDYSDLNSMRMEDWNMYTHVGEKTIEPSRLSLVRASNGKFDALSIVTEIRKNIDAKVNLDNLDEFLNYVKQNYN